MEKFFKSVLSVLCTPLICGSGIGATVTWLGYGGLVLGSRQTQVLNNIVAHVKSAKKERKIII